MARNTAVVLGDNFTDFIAGQVDHGRYGSASEVFRVGLRLLEEPEAKVQALRDAIREGEESGPPEAFDGQEFLAEMVRRHVR